uniref:Predicted protein n=1 Tax=Physcomitrium patens TaxID=3218 RepID=A9U693_PHYPA
METKILDDGSAYARRDYGGTKEEILSRDEGAFDASFIGILENGNIMYKKVDDFKRKERKRLYNIEGELCKLGTLQDDERILGVYEENGLEDSLELITSIGLGDNDKIVEIHSREVYTILESFQAPEVTVETKYKTADKKVKPVAGPLPEDSKEQMREASKEAIISNIGSNDQFQCKYWEARFSHPVTVSRGILKAPFYSNNRSQQIEKGPIQGRVSLVRRANWI